MHSKVKHLFVHGESKQSNADAPLPHIQFI